MLTPTTWSVQQQFTAIPHSHWSFGNARYLVDRGAAVNDGSPAGESVLDMARRFSGPELQRYLAAKVHK